MNPILFTPLYGPYRLVEAMLRRVRPTVPSAEWWLINCRYPLLKVADGIPQGRQLQNLAHELNLRWIDFGEELTEQEAAHRWSMKMPLESVAVRVPIDGCPQGWNGKGWLDFLVESFMELPMKFDAVTLTNASEQRLTGAVRMGLLQANQPPLVGRVLTGLDKGGTETYAVSLYDSELLEWRAAGEPGLLSKFLEAKT